MAVYGVNDGHTKTGPGSGAVGRIKESEHTRLVGNEVRRLFKEQGEGVVNCTIDYANSASESLDLIVKQANRQDLDWFIAIHFNAGGGKGVEVYTYEGRQYQDAIDVCKNIEKLGFKNRGVKAGTGLYVIRKTKAKAMLVEVCFVDTEDADKYLSVGYKAIAKAIVEGVLGREIYDPNRELVETYGASNQWCLFTWGFDRNESISAISKIDLNIPLYFVPYENGNKIWLNTGYVTKEEAEELWKKFADVNAKPQKLVSKEEWDWKVDRGLIF